MENNSWDPIQTMWLKILDWNRQTEGQTCWKHVGRQAKVLFSVSCSLQLYTNYRTAAKLRPDTHTSCSIRPCNLRQFHQSECRWESKCYERNKENLLLCFRMWVWVRILWRPWWLLLCANIQHVKHIKLLKSAMKDTNLFTLKGTPEKERRHHISGMSDIKSFLPLSSTCCSVWMIFRTLNFVLSLNISLITH